MLKIIKGRMTASIDDDFVVFLIGMRINKPWKLHRWIPIGISMQKMITELYQNPELGLLHIESWFGQTTIMIQYWKSFEHLDAYARSKTSTHLPAWTEFNKYMSDNTDVGIWHETYLSGKGKYECIYNNMPRFGLGRVGKHVPADGRLQTASSRLQRKKIIN